MLNVVYIGIMNSIGKTVNGFTKAFSEVCNYREVLTLNEVGECDLLFIQVQASGLNVMELQEIKKRGAFSHQLGGTVIPLSQMTKAHVLRER